MALPSPYQASTQTMKYNKKPVSCHVILNVLLKMKVQTWHCHNLTQLLLQGHDVFTQLNIIHPKERHEKGKSRAGQYDTKLQYCNTLVTIHDAQSQHE